MEAGRRPNAGRVVIFAALLGVLLLLSLADSAAAGVASTSLEPDCTVCKYGVTYRTLVTYRAASGEANTVSFRLTGEQVTFRDETAPVTAGEGCAVRSEHEVACSVTDNCCPPHLPRGQVEVGDGDDRVSVEAGSEALSLLFDGGAGSDVLTAGAFSATLVGGDGADTLTGGPKGDTLVDGGAGERDTFAGGGGRDALSYEDRPLQISLRIAGGQFEDSFDSIESFVGSRVGDLFVGGAGRDSFDGAGGADDVRGGGDVDRLGGGAGGDRVSGGSGADRLDGDAGNDRVSGGPGADFLDGGTGADRLRGGGGRDAISLGFIEYSDGDRQDYDNASDSISCGPGRDDVLDTGGQDLVPPDCERIFLGEDVAVTGSLRRSDPETVLARVVAVQRDPDFPLRLELRRRHKRLGRSARIRRDGTVRIRLNSAGRRVIRRGTRVVVRETSGDLEYATRIR